MFWILAILVIIVIYIFKTILIIYPVFTLKCQEIKKQKLTMITKIAKIQYKTIQIKNASKIHTKSLYATTPYSQPYQDTCFGSWLSWLSFLFMFLKPFSSYILSLH